MSPEGSERSLKIQIVLPPNPPSTARRSVPRAGGARLTWTTAQHVLIEAPHPLENPECATAEGKNGSHQDENPSKMFFFHDPLVDLKKK